MAVINSANLDIDKSAILKLYYQDYSSEVKYLLHVCIVHVRTLKGILRFIHRTIDSVDISRSCNNCRDEKIIFEIELRLKKPIYLYIF